MRYLAGYLTPAGALVMLVCFFLPWVVIECQPRTAGDIEVELPRSRVAEFSGLDLARARSIFWSIPISAGLVLFFTASRLPIRWRYRLSLISALGGLVFLAISYEDFQNINETHFRALLEQDKEGREFIGDLPPELQERVREAMESFERWRGSSGVEVAIDFRQPYSFAWGGCVLSLAASFVMLLRLSRVKVTEGSGDSSWL